VKSVRFWMVAVGAGLVLGLGIVGWLYWDKSSQAPVDRNGSSSPLSGSALLNSNQQSSGGGSIPVIGDGDQGSLAENSSQGQGTTSGESGGSSSGSQGQSVSNSSGSLPGPSDFSQYNAYDSSPTALFIDVQAGTGQAIAQGSVATVQYEGWLTNGTEFDSTYARKQPFTFTEGAGAVIPGWEEAIFGMKVGGERRLIVPPNLAFGTSGHGPIPANSVLIFDVTLISIKQ